MQGILDTARAAFTLLLMLLIGWTIVFIAGSLVERIDVLRAQKELILQDALCGCERSMGGVGATGFGLRAPLAVKAPHRPWVGGEPFWRGHFFDPMVFPKPVAVAECPNSGLSANARASEHKKAS